MSDCPYCGGTLADTNDGTRSRPPGHALKKCVSCASYCVKTQTRVAPLDDRANPDGDPVVRVIDEV